MKLSTLSYVVTSAILTVVAFVAMRPMFEARGDRATESPRIEESAQETSLVADVPSRRDANTRGLDFVLRAPLDFLATEPVRIRFRHEAYPKVVEVDAHVGVPSRLDVPPGRYRIEIDDVSPLAPWPDQVVVPEADSNDVRTRVLELNLFERRATTLVTRDLEGRRVEGVCLAFRRDGDSAVMGRVTTGSDGTATFDVPLGSYRFRFFGNDHSADGRPKHREVPEPVTIDADTKTIEITAESVVPYRLRVDADLFADGIPLDASRVRWFEVRWRGKTLRPTIAVDGSFQAEFESIHEEPAVDGPAKVFLSGDGIAEQSFTVEDPGAVRDTLAFTRTVEIQNGSFDGVYVDQNGHPIAGESLDLRIQQSTRHTLMVHRAVVTDDRGRFRVTGVEFPCSFYVKDRSPGRRIVPNEVEASTVTEGMVATVVRRTTHRVVVRIPDEIVRAQVVRDARSGIVFDVLPLGSARYRRLDLWDDGNKGLLPGASDQLAREGEFDLGDLPGGQYRVTLVVPELGTFGTECTVDESEPTTVVSVEIAPSATALEGVVRDGDKVATGAWVVDGYVPITAMRSVFENCALSAARSETMRACAIVHDSGRVTLASHNLRERSVTVLLEKHRVVHLSKAEFIAGASIERAEREGVVKGRVVDPHGHPAASRAVNLTSLHGGEGVSTMPWPRGVELLDILTDAEGRFEIAGVTPGHYVLSVAEITYASEGTERTFEFDPRASRVVAVERGHQEFLLELHEPGPTCDHAGH